MKFSPTKIQDVVLIDPLVHEDERGFLMETWHDERYRDAGIDASFVQDVHSASLRGTVRGLHYQVRQAQGKLVRVVRGEAFDVAVDLRRSSPTFGAWVGETLSEENRRLIWIPPGFAHGFMVMSDKAEFEYRLTDHYAPQFARTIRWDDPDIDIVWPDIGGTKHLISATDNKGVALREADVYA